MLFTIDDRPFNVALARADAQLAAIDDFVESHARFLPPKPWSSSLSPARTRRTSSASTTASPHSRSASSRRSSTSTRRATRATSRTRQIQVAERALDQIRARLGGDLDRPVTEQAAYLAAKSSRDAAALDLEHTVVRAPFDGIASKVPTLGQYVQPGAPVMTVVADHDMWIEANYKETDLTHVAAGQPVDISLDTYPDRRWRGRVESISQATGAEFSVIPAQNATGNWVKVDAADSRSASRSRRAATIPSYAPA